ncbi:MAG: outer membrane beta-barrel protein [Bacteroidales bacterium]|nr:outer membrane beta-barrel protein [Bacteroidales bacterium]
MKKTAILLILVLTFSSTCYSQISAGLNVGAGPGFVRLDSERIVEFDVKSKAGYTGGLFVRYDFSKYYVQFTPSYLNKGNLVVYNSSTEQEASAIHRIILPLSFGRIFFSGLRVYAGVGVDIMLNDEMHIENFVSSIPMYSDYSDGDEDISEANLDFHAGCSWEFSDFSVGVQYNASLMNDLYLDLDYEVPGLSTNFYAYYAFSGVHLMLGYKL